MFDPSKLILDEQETPSTEGSPSEGKEQKTKIVQEDILANAQNTEDKTEAVTSTHSSTEQVQTQEPVDILAETEVYSPKAVTKKAEEGKTDDVKAPDLPTMESHAPDTVVFDVNLKSIKNIIQHLLNNKYDYVTFEPDSEKVTVIFRENQTIAEKKYIPYPTYSAILLKAKEVAKLKLSETQIEQEGKSQVILDNQNYDILAKTVPSKNGEKLFFKTKLSKNQEKAKAKQKKSNLAQMLGFLGSVLIILLIIGSGFLSFVVLNAKTVEDVRFFESLGINLNQINNFIGTVVTIMFLMIIFFEVVGLVISLFRFLVIKKGYRQKKIKFGIISAILFILTFSTASAWLFIDKKVRELPQWALQALGEVQVYDNAKLLSDVFDQNGSFIKDTSNLIGPVEIKFDLSLLKENERKKGLDIKKFIWTFGDEEVVTTQPTLIRSFNTKGITELTLTLEETDAGGNIVEKNIENLPTINIQNLVEIDYKPMVSGGRKVTLDASDLKSLGKAEWYDLENLDTPKYTGYRYIYDTPITEDTLIGLYMQSPNRKNRVLDQVFVLEGEVAQKLSADIDFQQSKIDDLAYTFEATNIKSDDGTGGIETFSWKVDNKSYTKNADFSKLEASSKIKHMFKKYGEHTISLTITDFAGNTKTVTEVINIQKSLSLKTQLRIVADGKKVEPRYDPALHEYFIDELPVPATIQLDSRLLRSTNPNYYLTEVEWDYNNDGDIDDKGKIGKFEILKEEARTITAQLTFKNKRDETDIVKLEEKLYFQSVQKEAIVDFKIIKSSEYIPTKVKLDASKSSVSGKNIAKFIWDFGDGGQPQSGDSIVDGHYYNKEGDYEIKLTIVTSDGKRYNATKNLILKPTPQEAKVRVSMKKAPAFQEIDFSSSDSTGDIIGYFWDFGDGETSSKANPSHMYSKAGTYEVQLRLDYRNNNFKEATQEIEVY